MKRQQGTGGRFAAEKMPHPRTGDLGVTKKREKLKKRTPRNCVWLKKVKLTKIPSRNCISAKRIRQRSRLSKPVVQKRKKENLDRSQGPQFVGETALRRRGKKMM